MMQKVETGSEPPFRRGITMFTRPSLVRLVLLGLAWCGLGRRDVGRRPEVERAAPGISAALRRQEPRQLERPDRRGPAHESPSSPRASPTRRSRSCKKPPTRRPWRTGRPRTALIHYDGARGIGNIETREHFGDFELYLDWKIPKGGDSGIFPRNMPQVQIWDPAGGKRNVVGSGGLDNNGPDIPPKKKADNPVGRMEHVLHQDGR